MMSFVYNVYKDKVSAGRRDVGEPQFGKRSSETYVFGVYGAAQG